MVDVVVNHLASKDSPPSFSSFNPFNKESDFHPRCLVTDYNNQTQVEQCWLGDDKLALIDVNTENDDIVNTYNDWIKTLVGNYSIDGIRIDTVKHIRKDFWPKFASSSGVYAIGEVLHNETDYVAGYTRQFVPVFVSRRSLSRLEVLDAVLDYPTWSPLVAGFQTQFGNLSALAKVITTSQGAYKNGLFGTGSFLENHDQPRFPSLSNDAAVWSAPCATKLRSFALSEVEKCDRVPVHSRRHPYCLLWCSLLLESCRRTLLMDLRSGTGLFGWTGPCEP